MENYCIKKEVYCDLASNLGICQSTSCINGTVAHGDDHYKYYPTTHTNADRIRSMNDKELAEYIFDLGNGSEYCYGHCAYQDDCATKGLDHDTCIKGVIDWLKQPVKEECNETN